MSRSTFQTRVRVAASRGFAPGHFNNGVAPGYVMGGVLQPKSRFNCIAHSVAMDCFMQIRCAIFALDNRSDPIFKCV